MQPGFVLPRGPLATPSPQGLCWRPFGTWAPSQAQTDLRASASWPLCSPTLSVSTPPVSLPLPCSWDALLTSRAQLGPARCHGFPSPGKDLDSPCLPSLPIPGPPVASQRFLSPFPTFHQQQNRACLLHPFGFCLSFGQLGKHSISTCFGQGPCLQIILCCRGRYAMLFSVLSRIPSLQEPTTYQKPPPTTQS